MSEIWPDSFVEENNLTMSMNALRKKALGERRGEHKYIETVAKHGYRFIAKVREIRDESFGRRAVSSERSDEATGGRDKGIGSLAVSRGAERS